MCPYQTAPPTRKLEKFERRPCTVSSCVTYFCFLFLLLSPCERQMFHQQRIAFPQIAARRNRDAMQIQEMRFRELPRNKFAKAMKSSSEECSGWRGGRRQQKLEEITLREELRDKKVQATCIWKKVFVFSLVCFILHSFLETPRGLRAKTAMVNLCYCCWPHGKTMQCWLTLKANKIILK